MSMEQIILCFVCAAVATAMVAFGFTRKPRRILWVIGGFLCWFVALAYMVRGSGMVILPYPDRWRFDGVLGTRADVFLARAGQA